MTGTKSFHEKTKFCSLRETEIIAGYVDINQESGTDGFTSDEETKLIDRTKDGGKVDGEKTSKYPRSVFFIIGNEFCERFSYYGMRTILTLYLAKVLLYSENTATIIFHVFSMACYFTPLFGAMIADSFLGKFKTIFYISIIYVIGNITISIGSIPNNLQTMAIISLVGLLLIAFGTGGIKPCVSAFGGDQFQPGQEKYLQQFFSLFYMSINMGSVISTVLTPMLRTGIYCFNQDSCYPLAFGVPAILMIIALIIFLLGKPMYKVVPPSGNVVANVFKCITHALVRRTQVTGEKKEHWLEYADDKFDPKFIRNIKDVLHVLFLYLPLPVFWALFDQQGSRWTLQAAKMDGAVGSITIEPDQMQVINPVLIIIFIPLFEYIVYPLLKKCHLLITPLQRMTCGGVLAALAFVVAGFLQMHMESYSSGSLYSNKLAVINNSPCKIVLNGSFEANLLPFKEHYIEDIVNGENYTWNFKPEDCSLGDTSSETYIWTANSKEFVTVTISESKKTIAMKNSITVIEDSSKGYATLQLIFNLKRELATGDTISFLLKGPSEHILQSNVTKRTSIGFAEGFVLPPGKYKIYPSLNDSSFSEESIYSVFIKSGAHYALGVYEEQRDPYETEMTLFLLVEGRLVPMLYIFPQYFLITAGEIMMSITGLEFSYSQSPKSMKSVLQAAWLLTVAFGNLIVVIVAEIQLFEKQSYEFFMFAFLMGVDMLIFAIMTYFYKYVEVNDEDEYSAVGEIKEIEDCKTKEINEGKVNQGYVEDTKF